MSDPDTERLRKYAKMYNKFINTVQDISEDNAKHVKKSQNVKSDKKLNAYQIFVREESKKQKYKNYSAEERLRSISKAWKRKKENTTSKT